MAIDLQGISLTDDHTLETASEVMSQLQFDRRLPNGRQSYMELLNKLGFRDNQDGEENTQSVSQGQCLILGDARVGKTSLKKSLIGRSFDAQEKVTRGVEVSLTDHKWKELDVDAGLTFGSFARFRQSVLYEAVMYGPGGIEFGFNQEITSMMSAIARFFFMLLRISWVISVMWLLSSATVSVSFCALSFVMFSLAILFHFIPSEHPEGLKIAMLLYCTLPHFIMGLGIEYLLMGLLKCTNCSNPENELPEKISFSGCQNIWVIYLFAFALLLSEISIDTCFLFLKYFKVKICTWYDGVESSLPGQIKLKDSLPIFPQIFVFIVSVITGFGFGCIIESLTNMSALQYCQTLHLTITPLFWTVIYRITQSETLRGLVSWQSIILLVYVTVDIGGLSLSPSFSLTTYVGMFAAWAFTLLCDDLTDLHVFVRETQASFTFIFIAKIMLNFQKLKNALHKKFSSLKLKLLDFSGDKEYYAYHHIFMRDRALYIVVFNMANFADDNYGNIGPKTQRICFWLESICSKAVPKTPVFLVGTHRGNMDKHCLKSIDKHLRRNLLHIFSDELVINKEENLVYFPTENSLGCKDRGIQNLRKAIMSTAQEHKSAIGRDIPYSWIKIQDAIITLRENKQAKFCVSLQQFPISVGNFICSNWSKETLRYFHEKGLVIYVDQGQDSEMSEWILLKPDILVDIILKLVTPLTDEQAILQQGFRRDWELLHSTGMLTESLLEKILSSFNEDTKALQSFLEQYHIISPLFYNVKDKEEETQVTHFVPSLLPLSTDTVSTPVWLDGPNDMKFYVFFHRFLPEPLFQNLLSRAHKLSREEFPRGQPVICRDVGRFWFTPNLPYRLLKLKNQEMIEVTFNCRLGKTS